MGYGRRSVAGDPHWITARRAGGCTSRECQMSVRPGDRVFYYPKGQAVYCVACSPAVAARAEGELMDDDLMGSW